jgi:hypothetical protein
LAMLRPWFFLPDGLPIGDISLSLAAWGGSDPGYSDCAFPPEGSN